MPPWDTLSSPDLPICQDLEKIKRIEKLYSNISEYMDLEEMVESTECIPPCLYNEYTLALEKGKYASKFDDNLYGTKSIILMFPDKKTIIKKEMEFYSLVSLVSDIGGALGLFLGFSFLMVWDELEIFVRKTRKYWNGKSSATLCFNI